MSTDTQTPLPSPEDDFAVSSSTWEQLSQVARNALLRLAIQQNGSLYYIKQHVGAFEELEQCGLVHRTRTPAEGRQWTMNTHAITLLHSLPDSEDVRLKWIRSLHQPEP